MSQIGTPEQGIVWRGWDDETLRLIAERGWPVLLFVADPDPLVRPFLSAIFPAMPRDARLRELLHDFVPLFIKANELPDELKAYGAGSRYHIAVLSPHGFNPLVTVNVLRPPEEVIAAIIDTLERFSDIWR